VPGGQRLVLRESRQIRELYRKCVEWRERIIRVLAGSRWERKTCLMIWNVAKQQSKMPE